MTMTRADVIVVGGGIAGLSVAYYLARLGTRRIRLIEREPVLASHSTGRNAAIFRPLDETPGVMALAHRSRELLDALLDVPRAQWLRRTGLLFVADDEAPLGNLVELAQRSRLSHEVVGREALPSLVPVLAGGAALCGLFVADAGVMDTHAITAALARGVRAAGGEILAGREVRGVRVEGGEVQGVDLANGDALHGGIVVIAAGAWASGLGASCGAALPLIPFRRHLVHLKLSVTLAEAMPVVWRLRDEVYVRSESGGALASPCDEEPWPPALPPTSESAVELLARKLTRLAPPTGQGAVHRAWACLRTFAPDRTMVAGEDPRVRGLFWLAGLGGHGMTAGTAAGELVAQLIAGSTHPLARTLAPARLVLCD